MGLFRKRQPKGVPTGGEFAANAHDEAAAMSVPDMPGWIEGDDRYLAFAEPTAEDYSRAREYAKRLGVTREEFARDVAWRDRHARAFEAGIPTPYDRAFDETWNGSVLGTMNASNTDRYLARVDTSGEYEVAQRAIATRGRSWFENRLFVDAAHGLTQTSNEPEVVRPKHRPVSGFYGGEQ